MITENGIRKLKRYCREPIENIKGYREAVESEGKYVCHHINELTFTREELIKMNMYYHRPVSELIIMTISDHIRWHIKWNCMYVRSGENNGMHGKGYLISSERHPAWKGDDVGSKGAYLRARKLYNAGKLTEEEFQTYRYLYAEYQRERRRHKEGEAQWTDQTR